MFWYILIGMVIAQFICFATFLISDRHEDITLKAGCGLFLVPFNFCARQIRQTRRRYINKKYIIIEIKTLIPYHQYAMRARIKRKWYNDYYHEGENGDYIQMVDEPSRYSPVHLYPNLRTVNDNTIVRRQDWIKAHLLKGS